METTTKAPPKKKAKSIPKPKKEKRFCFLDLPAELRDMIYDITLADANGVSIMGQQSNYRHIARRGKVFPSEAYQSYRRRSRGYLTSGSQELSPISTDFVPALLAVNKQINAEAINYLYGHDFIFADPTALHSFLATIGPRNQQRLNDIAIMAWGHSGVGKGNNHSSLTLLAGATQLKALRLSCDVRYYSSKPQYVARRVFLDAHWFLEAYGAANGRKDAAVDIFHLKDENFQDHYWAGQPVDKNTAAERFRTELRSLLGVETPKGKSRA